MRICFVWFFKFLFWPFLNAKLFKIVTAYAPYYLSTFFFHAQVAESLPLIWIIISAPNSQNPQTLSESQAKKIIGHLDKLVGEREIFTGSSTQQSCDGSNNAAYGMSIKQNIWKKNSGCWYNFYCKQNMSSLFAILLWWAYYHRYLQPCQFLPRWCTAKQILTLGS